MSRRRKKPAGRRRRAANGPFGAGVVTRIESGEASSASFGDEACSCPGRLDAFVQGIFAKHTYGEDYEDFFVEAPLPDSALEALTVAMETGVPQNWQCEHGRHHLSGLAIEGTP